MLAETGGGSSVEVIVPREDVPGGNMSRGNVLHPNKRREFKVLYGPESGVSNSGLRAPAAHRV